MTPRVLCYVFHRRSRLPVVSRAALEPVEEQKPAGYPHTCVTRIQLHRLEALMLLQHSTSPLPDTAQIRLATELIAPLGH